MYQSVLAEDPQNADAAHYGGLVRYQQGDLDGARTLLERALALTPHDANVFSNLGMVLSALEQYDKAMPLFAQALRLDPQHTDALNNIAVTMKKLHRHRDALPLFERVVRSRPDNADALFNLGETQYRINRIDEAIETYLKALEIDPRHSAVRLALGEAYESTGHFREARMQYLAILRQPGRHVLALARLLQLRDGEVEQPLLDKAEELSCDPETPGDGRIRLNVALAHYYDRTGRYDAAFDHLQAGCDAQFAKEPFDSERFSRSVDELIEVFSEDFFASLPTPPSSSERPLFIVGMPRSGTTLIEQILASHSQVAAGGELSMLLQVGMQTQVLSANGKPYPYSVPGLNDAARAQLAASYLENLDRISPDARRVTDKLPFNFMHLGLVALLFPNARIVHCSRAPMDNCLSCYFTSFADRIQFANDLQTLGRYYADYRRLMAHWRKVLPIQMFDIQYEDMVSETEAHIRALLAYCGLDWEDACMRFHETERGIKTPSRWQVRQPIYARSVERWRNYERQLAPLAAILAPFTGEAG